MSGQLPDFDTMQTMARHDPDGLERLRLKLVSELIANAEPEQRRRLHGLQFQIDMERRRAANPLAACIRLSSLMRDSLLRMQQVLNEPRHQRAVSSAAQILRFSPAFTAQSFEHSTRV